KQNDGKASLAGLMPPIRDWLENGILLTITMNPGRNAIFFPPGKAQALYGCGKPFIFPPSWPERRQPSFSEHWLTGIWSMSMARWWETPHTNTLPGNTLCLLCLKDAAL